jgi:hypothetical protein
MTPLAVILVEHTDGDWHFVKYADGTHQWQYRGNTRYFAEVVIKEKSRRKHWAVVDRGGKRDDVTMYPRAVLSKFANEDGARAALKFIIDTNQPTEE